MDPRIYFFESFIKDKSERILELGPLNRPIADKSAYPNTFYCDVRSTQEVRELYSGNDYLEATGLVVDPETIVPIDFVVKESYKETFANVEKFDCVIASHVLEHMEDLIFALRDISTVLNRGGVFYIVYPDKRYCFDHFRTSASFRDAYNVFRNGAIKNAPMVLDFYFSVISENDPCTFWNKQEILKYLPRESFERAIEHYEEAMNGVKMDDVHYWPFTDMDFLKFLYDCTRAKLIPFRCVSFCPCLQNDQQFMVALQYDPDVMVDSEQALSDLTEMMGNAIPDYFSSGDLILPKKNEELRTIVKAERNALELQKNAIEILKRELNDKEERIEIQSHEINCLRSQILEYEEIIKEQKWENMSN